MRITGISLKHFRRFTNLVVRDIPATSKLVVIVGPNGCGKSSLFDALLYWYRTVSGIGGGVEQNYTRKQDDVNAQESVVVTTDGDEPAARGCLYVRTAYRNDPDFNIGDISRQESPSDTIRVNRAIDNDQAVAQNYRRLIYDTVSGVYDPTNDAKTVAKLREELIGQVRKSMKTVFGDLLLNNISDPLGQGTFTFEKGASKSYHYKNLSGGEKAAFDLLLDLHVKKRYFKNAIYCIDELETHLHTKVQGNLLREMVEILPEAAQLWVTTHSLGVLRSALDMATEKPGSVSVIDFDGIDPDVPGEIEPSNLGRVTWEKLMSIALDDLSQRIAPQTVVVCEGSSIGNRRKDFDAEIYNRILGSQTAGILFVSGGSSNQVAQSGISVQSTLTSILSNSRVISLCDMDDKSPAEVTAFETGGNIVLSKRNLESFLFADDVIEALVIREGKTALLQSALAIKSTALADSVARGNAPDDLKSAAGKIFVHLKSLLQLQRPGNTTEAFMRDTLAPLIKPPLKSFHELKAAVTDRIP